MFELIQQALLSVQDLDKKEGMEAYMRNQFPFLGVQATPRRKVINPLFKGIQKQPINWDLIHQLWQADEREYQYVALDILKKQSKQLTYEDIPTLKKLAQTKSWWDTIDVLDRLIGNIGLTDSRVDDLMITWSEDDDFWLRRISIDHQIGRKEKTNIQLLETIIINNLNSSEFFINKAIGWSLREYSKIDPEYVKKFITLHDKQMARLSIREALKRINK